MMYVSQVITLYTLNLYSAVCQSYLNKAGRKKIFLNKTRKQSHVQVTTCHISDFFPLASKAMLEYFQTFLLKWLSYQPCQ